MSQAQTQEYLRNVVLSAPPEKLHLMLYDGAIRFCRQARDAIQSKEIEKGYSLLTKAQNIILEMENALRHEVAPDLCNRMASLYAFIYRRLVDANMHRDVQALDEALRILEYQRETWVMLIDKLAEESQSSAPQSAPASTTAPVANAQPARRRPPTAVPEPGSLSVEA